MPLTAVTRDLVFRLNLKLILCFKVQSLTKVRLAFPKPLEATKRYVFSCFTMRAY